MPRRGGINARLAYDFFRFLKRPLHGQLGQRVHGLPVVAHGERLKAEQGLQLDQVLAPGLLPLPVLVPVFDADLELVGDQFQ